MMVTSMLLMVTGSWLMPNTHEPSQGAGHTLGEQQEQRCQGSAGADRGVGSKHGAQKVILDTKLDLVLPIGNKEGVPKADIIERLQCPPKMSATIQAPTPPQLTK